LCTAN